MDSNTAIAAIVAILVVIIAVIVIVFVVNSKNKDDRGDRGEKGGGSEEPTEGEGDGESFGHEGDPPKRPDPPKPPDTPKSPPDDSGLKLPKRHKNTMQYDERDSSMVAIWERDAPATSCTCPYCGGEMRPLTTYCEICQSSYSRSRTASVR